MKKISFISFILLLVFSTSDGDTFTAESTDYDIEDSTTLSEIPTTTLSEIPTTTLSEIPTTILTISSTSSTTSIPTQISLTTPSTTLIPTTTIENLRENQNEANINMVLSFFSLENMKSWFNNLTNDLDEEQIKYLNNTRNLTKMLEEEHKSAANISAENIILTFKEMKEDLEIYQNLKKETEEKIQKVRENYLREIFTLEMNWIHDQINYYKQHNNLMNKIQLYITLESMYRATNNTGNHTEVKEKLDNIKRHQKDLIRLEENYQKHLNKTNKSALKMASELTKLFNDARYDQIFKKFYEFIEIKKAIETHQAICTNYSVETNLLMTDFTMKLSNFSSNLTFSKFMPSDTEIINIVSKNSNKSEIPPAKISRSLDRGNYKWIQSYQGNQHLTVNAVVGGQDIDGVPFYVARIKDYKSYLYGKFAFSKGRKHAYFPYEYAEYGVENFEILTSPNYIWCAYDNNKNYEELPICRAEYNSSVIPGTLQKNGVCRIGYNYKVFRFSNDNFKVLRLGGC